MSTSKHLAEVDYIINADAAFAVADRLQARFSSIQTQANAVLPSAASQQSFSSGLDSAIQKAQALRTTLRDATAVAQQAGPGSIWNTWATGANRAATQVRGLYSELKDLQAAAGAARNPVALQLIHQRAKEVNAELDRLNVKMERVAAGRVAAQQRISARQGGSIGPGGFGFAGSAFSAVPGPAGDALNTGLNIFEGAAAAGLSGGAALGLGGGVAAAVLLLQYSKSLADEAKKRLKYEEAIAAARNQTIKASKQEIFDLRLQRQAAEDQRTEADFRATASPEELRRRKEFLLNQIGDETRGVALSAAEFNAEIIQIDATLAGLGKEADQKFQERWETYKKNQEDAARFEAEQIEKGKARIKELETTWKGVFNQLSSQAGASNPFTSVINESREAVEQLKMDIKGLPAAMQQAALGMQRELNANRLFETRLDTRLQANDLRMQANAFRNYRPGESDADYQQRVTAGLTAAQRSGFFGLNQVPQNLTSEDQRRLYSQSLISAAVNNVPGLTPWNQQTVAIGAFQNAQQRREQSMTAQERFDAQLAIIEGLRPENEEQRSTARRRALAVGGDGRDLSQDQRDKLARLAEEEASKLDRAENEALVREKARDANISAIAGYVKTLSEVNEGENGGIRAVENKLNVTVRSEEGIKVKATRADSSDVAVEYSKYQGAL